MNIRFATEADLPQVNELRRQVSMLHAQGRPDFFKSGFPQELQKLVYDMIASEEHDVIVAETATTIVGFACIKYVDRPETAYRTACRYIEVDEVGVDEGCRKQEIGRALFEEIKRIARERDLHRINLNMWEFNESALRFYESIGFCTYRRYLEFTI